MRPRLPFSRNPTLRAIRCLPAVELRTFRLIYHRLVAGKLASLCTKTRRQRPSANSDCNRLQAVPGLILFLILSDASLRFSPATLDAITTWFLPLERWYILFRLRAKKPARHAARILPHFVPKNVQAIVRMLMLHRLACICRFPDPQSCSAARAAP